MIRSVRRKTLERRRINLSVIPCNCFTKTRYGPLSRTWDCLSLSISLEIRRVHRWSSL